MSVCLVSVNSWNERHSDQGVIPRLRVATDEQRARHLTVSLRAESHPTERHQHVS